MFYSAWSIGIINHYYAHHRPELRSAIKSSAPHKEYYKKRSKTAEEQCVVISGVACPKIALGSGVEIGQDRVVGVYRPTLAAAVGEAHLKTKSDLICLTLQ